MRDPLDSTFKYAQLGMGDYSSVYSVSKRLYVQ